MQILLFVVADLCPSGESIWKGPTIECEANAVQDGYTGILRVPESRGKQVRVSEGGEGGVIVIRRAGSAMSRDRERFHPGENKGREEGSYRSNKLTREKTRG